MSEVLKDLRNRVESGGYVLESATMKVLGNVEGSWEWVTFTARVISSPNVKEHAPPLAGASVETGGEG